jgi:hypothetical protein
MVSHGSTIDNKPQPSGLFRLLISNLQAFKVGTQEEATLSLFNLRVPDSKGNTSPMCMIYL